MKNALALLALLALSTAASAQSILRVDASLTTGANDGSSWSDAFQGPLGLQAALAAATAGDQVWVAGGTYHPVAAGGDRSVSFVLEDQVSLYGGFQGGESELADRPPIGSFPSILSGDNAEDDTPGFGNQGDNSFHVLLVEDGVAAPLLDGFTVTAGAATGGGLNEDRGGGIFVRGGGIAGPSSGPRIHSCRFVGNRSAWTGGAVYVNGMPRFRDCSFEDNQSIHSGGAIHAEGSALVFVQRCSFTGNRARSGGAVYLFALSGVGGYVANCLFRGNVATAAGGGAIVLGGGGQKTLRSCTIVENSSTAGAEGGVLAVPSAPVVNCVLWANSGAGGAMASANQINPDASVEYSLVMGGFAGGPGNIGAAPLFVDPAADDYALAPGSPGIDAGKDYYPSPTWTLDIAGRGRLRDDPATPDTGVPWGSLPVIDMGAWEYQAGAVGISYCAAVPNSTGLPGGLRGSGSDVAADNDVTLTAFDLPPDRIGLLAVSRFRDPSPSAAGSQGTLCLGGAPFRHGPPADSGPGGTFDVALDLASIPTPAGAASALAGDSWCFQVWYRDTDAGVPVSNFTNALWIRFF